MATARAMALMLNGLVMHLTLFPQMDRFFAQTTEASMLKLY